MTHPNVDLLGRVHAAFTAGDITAPGEHFCVVWHTAGAQTLAATCQVKKATFAAFQDELERSEGSYQVESRNALANDQLTVAPAPRRRPTAGAASGAGPRYRISRRGR